MGGLIVACSERTQFSAGAFGFEIAEPGEGSVGTQPGTPITEQPPICDPFGSGTGGSPDNGLAATLTYIPADQASYNMTLDQFLPGKSNVVQIANTVFLSNLDKPTTYFNDGFQDDQGTYLKNSDGDNLIEYFALFIAGKIKLKSSDPEGEYEFAVLSDDGAILQFKQNGAWNKHIDNDNTHADKLGCTAQSVNLKHGDSLPLELGYFQAPRYYITLSLYWRNTHIGENEPFCGGAISNATDFAARGWKLLDDGNFFLPDNVTENPCN